MILKLIFWPISLMFKWKSQFSSHLFDLGVWKSMAFEKPVIYVGSFNSNQCGLVSGYLNYVISANGMKTAVHVSNKFLRNKHCVERQEEGLLYHQAYDEMSIENVFTTRTSKILGLSEWFQFHPETDVVIMNDSFAKDEIRPAIRVLVTDFITPFFEAHYWPIGPLKNHIKFARDADIVVVVGDSYGIDVEDFKLNMKKYLSDSVSIFYSKRQNPSTGKFNSTDQIEFSAEGDNFADLIIKSINTVNSKVESE